jgi:hypothetical protein
MLLLVLNQIIGVYSDNLTKHINTPCGRQEEVLNIKEGGV